MNKDINELEERVEFLIADIRRLDELKDIVIEMKQNDRDELEVITEQLNKLKSVERKRGKSYE